VPLTLFDDLIRPLQERRRDRQAEGLGGCAEALHDGQCLRMIACAIAIVRCTLISIATLGSHPVRPVYLSARQHPHGTSSTSPLDHHDYQPPRPRL
jgi:hypothetical protein